MNDSIPVFFLKGKPDSSHNGYLFLLILLYCEQRLQVRIICTKKVFNLCVKCFNRKTA